MGTGLLAALNGILNMIYFMIPQTAESEEELKSLLMKVKKECEKACLKLKIGRAHV